MYQKVDDLVLEKQRSNFQYNHADLQIQGQSCNTTEGKSLERLVMIYEILQYFILFGSITMLIALRVYYNFFIMDISTEWTVKADGVTPSKCYRNFTMMAGVMYAISTLGIVEFFLYRDSIKKLANANMSVRAYLKIIIEGASFLFLLIDLVLVLFGIFNNCGQPNEDGKRPHVAQAERVLYFALALYSLNLLSLVLYFSMRRTVLNNASKRLYFEHNIQINY